MADAAGRDQADSKPSGPNSSTSARAAELRATGLTYAEIGRRLGVSKQRIFSLLNGDHRASSRPVPVDESKNVLTTREVAFLLGVHENTVRRWAATGALESFRAGLRGDRRFERSVVQAFLGSIAPAKPRTDRPSLSADKPSRI